MPVCDATRDVLKCIDYLKRFVLFMESRFNNLTLSVAQSNIDMNNSFEFFKKELNATFNVFEDKMNKKIEFVE